MMSFPSSEDMDKAVVELAVNFVVTIYIEQFSLISSLNLSISTFPLIFNETGTKGDDVKKAFYCTS